MSDYCSKHQGKVCINSLACHVNGCIGLNKTHDQQDATSDKAAECSDDPTEYVCCGHPINDPPECCENFVEPPAQDDMRQRFEAWFMDRYITPSTAPSILEQRRGVYVIDSVNRAWHGFQEGERQAREAAIEDCARVIEAGVHLHDDAPSVHIGRQAAMAIRALKERNAK